MKYLPLGNEHVKEVSPTELNCKLFRTMGNEERGVDGVESSIGTCSVGNENLCDT